MVLQNTKKELFHLNSFVKGGAQKMLNSATIIGLLGLSGLTYAADNVPVPSARITNTQSLIPIQYEEQTLPQQTQQLASQSVTSQSTQQSMQVASQITSQITSQVASDSANTVNTRYTSAQLLNDPLFNAMDISQSRLSNVSAPSVSLKDISYVQTNTIPTTRYGGAQDIDVSLLDDFIVEIGPNARHYPPNFKNASERYYSKEKLKVLEQWLRPYAESSDASFEVLIRAAKLNGMARNLDLGSDYAVRASNYIAKAISIQPNDAEANFLYGMMLSEGGGFKEGAKYLNKAASLGYIEAEQSLAQSDLINDRRADALSRLQRLQVQNPNNVDIPRQIQIVENGDYYIWDLSTQ